MIKLSLLPLIGALSMLFFTHATSAEGFIKKEVYSFKDANGNTIFTDKKPDKKQAFKTQTIEAANSTGDTQINNVEQNNYIQREYSNTPISQQQTVRIIVEDDNATEKKSYKKKHGLRKCKSYKKKFDYYSDKMNSGYKASEYNTLEKNRKKYKNLLFNNCDTITFAD